eukprot:GGOE01043879.1.p1 GENE.GGOE01043879.1~~GGOE01043879.1.p1  ORF type:complete len:195 (-),score=73.32 GGOE01043879.1:518-1063(-)
MAAIVPPCKWAQRKERVYLTVDVTDATDVKVVFEPKKVTFSGQLPAGPFGHTFHLFAEINAEESSHKSLGRELQINLKKKDVDGGYWDRLTEEPSKASKTFLSCDWDRWVDEEDDAGEVADFGYGNMDDMDYGGADSDDEDAPLDDLDGGEGDKAAHSHEHSHEGGCCSGHGDSKDGEAEQ